MARKRRTLAVTAHHGHGRRNTWTQAKKRHELGKCYRKRDHSFKTCFPPNRDDLSHNCSTAGIATRTLGFSCMY